MHVKPNNISTMIALDFKVDTGANCTTISHVELAKLGYQESWIRSGKPLFGDAAPTVASGLPISGCYEVILPEIRIGDCG